MQVNGVGEVNKGMGTAFILLQLQFSVHAQEGPFGRVDVVRCDYRSLVQLEVHFALVVRPCGEHQLAFLVVARKTEHMKGEYIFLPPCLAVPVTGFLWSTATVTENLFSLSCHWGNLLSLKF